MKYIFGPMVAVMLASCGEGNKEPAFRLDSKGNTVPVSDYVCVAVDETFKPVFEVLFADFRDRNFPTEHYRQAGRQAIAYALYNALYSTPWELHNPYTEETVRINHLK